MYQFLEMIQIKPQVFKTQQILLSLIINSWNQEVIILSSQCKQS